MSRPSLLRIVAGVAALVAIGGTAVAIGAPRAPRLGPPPQGRPFDAFVFFNGASLGEVVLHLPFGVRKTIQVESQGTALGDTLHLVQTIRQGGKTRTREWQLRRTAPGRYTGTLTDADGPVEAVENGGRLTIRYHARAGYDIAQVLDRVADDQVENTLTASIAGLPIAVARETIVSAAPAEPQSL